MAQEIIPQNHVRAENVMSPRQVADQLPSKRGIRPESPDIDDFRGDSPPHIRKSTRQNNKKDRDSVGGLGKLHKDDRDQAGLKFSQEITRSNKTPRTPHEERVATTTSERDRIPQIGSKQSSNRSKSNFSTDNNQLGGTTRAARSPGNDQRDAENPAKRTYTLADIRNNPKAFPSNLSADHARLMQGIPLTRADSPPRFPPTIKPKSVKKKGDRPHTVGIDIEDENSGLKRSGTRSGISSEQQNRSGVKTTALPSLTSQTRPVTKAQPQSHHMPNVMDQLPLAHKSATAPENFKRNQLPISGRAGGGGINLNPPPLGAGQTIKFKTSRDDNEDHPPENEYETRPMSPHPAYRLADHVRPTGTLIAPPEVKDNFEARMRALFLPSLFGSSGDVRSTTRGTLNKSKSGPGIGNGKTQTGESGQSIAHSNSTAPLNISLMTLSSPLDQEGPLYPSGVKTTSGRGGNGYSDRIDEMTQQQQQQQGSKEMSKQSTKNDRTNSQIDPTKLGMLRGHDDNEKIQPSIRSSTTRFSIVNTLSGQSVSAGRRDLAIAYDPNNLDQKARRSTIDEENGGDGEGVPRQNSTIGGGDIGAGGSNGATQWNRARVTTPKGRAAGSKRNSNSARAKSARAKSAKRRAQFMSSVRAADDGNIKQSTGRGGLIIPIATIDRAQHEMYPPDLDKSQLRWRLVMLSVLKGNKIKREVLEDKTMDSNFDQVSPALAKEMSLNKDRFEVICAMRVKRILDIPLSAREEKDLDALDSILGRYQFFAKLPPAARYKLYNACRLETFPRGTVLIREGLQARCCYVVLLGECLHQMRPDQPTCATTRVSTGGCVGEFSSYAINEIRNMRSTMLMRTEVLRIDKGDYVTITREAKNFDTYSAEFFQTVPALFGVDKHLPILLSQRSLVRRYEPETLIVKAGEISPNVYFIVRGRVRALHMVTFTKVDQGVIPGATRHKYTLVPFRNSKNGPNDEVVRELASVADLTAGQYFPPLMPSKVTAESTPTGEPQGSDNRRVSTAVPFSTAATERDPDAIQSPFHFIVIEKVEVVVIARQDLFELLPRDALRRLKEHRALTDVSSQEIEERYLTAQGWRGKNELTDTKTKGDRDEFGKDNASWSNPVWKDKYDSAKPY
ncbi:hypothetical protein HDU76_006850 [Blyttiomyces sp. JEL0837]|nr:hypothetical protein HDU76_006850 [Blyttiomyces sp. JEL0837]